MTRRRLAELGRNLVLAAGTVSAHAVEDPLLLVLQTSRRLPRGAVRLAARAVVTCGRRSDLAAALAAWLTGHAAEAAAHLERATSRPVPAAEARLVGELAVQVGRADLIERLPDAAPVALRARAAWTRGALSEAIRVLETSDGPSGLLQRYRSQAEVLRTGTWLTPPRRAPRPTGRALPSAEPAAFHLLTNSLPHTASGYTVRSHEVLRAQQRAGVRVAAATRLGYPVSVGVLGAHHTDVVDGVPYARSVPRRLPRDQRARLQAQVDDLASPVRAFRPTVLHTTTDLTNGLVTRALADGAGVPWVYEARGLLEETWVAGRATPEERRTAAASERYALLRAREAEVASAADHVVTLSRTMREDLVARGVRADRVTVIPNAVNEALLDTALTPPDARELVGLERDGFWVGTVSSLVDYEGLETLIDAVAVLAERRVDVRCCVVGDGVSRNALERRAVERGVGDRVVFVGRVPRERAVLHHQALDLFAVPRRDLRVCRVVTPLKPVEAMACARPVVASDLPALAEIVGEPRAGVLARPDDASAWADAIEELADQPGLRADLGAAGRAFAAGRTWERAGATYRDLYERLAET